LLIFNFSAENNTEKMTTHKRDNHILAGIAIEDPIAQIHDAFVDEF